MQGKVVRVRECAGWVLLRARKHACDPATLQPCTLATRLHGLSAIGEAAVARRTEER